MTNCFFKWTFQSPLHKNNLDIYKISSRAISISQYSAAIVILPVRHCLSIVFCSFKYTYSFSDFGARADMGIYHFMSLGLLFTHSYVFKAIQEVLAWRWRSEQVWWRQRTLCETGDTRRLLSQTIQRQMCTYSIKVISPTHCGGFAPARLFWTNWWPNLQIIFIITLLISLM